MNIVRPILRHGRTQPEVIALIEDERTISYAALRDRVLRTAARFAAAGVRAGARVGICLRDSPDHLVALLACGIMDATAAPMDWRARPNENARIAEVLAPALVLVEPGRAFPAPCPVIPVDAAWQQAVEGRAAVAAASTGADVPFVVAATSGTTGLPKFSISSHLQYYFRITEFLEFQVLPRPCRYLSSSPLYFAAGQRNALAHLLRGDTVILHAPLFTAADYVEAVARLKVDISFVVPSVVRQLLQVAGGSAPLLPTIRALVTGGAPLFAHERLDVLHKLTPNFYERYGSSMMGGIATLSPAEMTRRPDSVGQINPLVEAEVADDQGRPVAAGNAGRLRLRGPALGTPLIFPEQPASEEFRDGWYYPGELGWIDDHDFLFLQGRASDVIMRGGAKIHPAEIEAAILDHPDVLEAAVTGVRGADNEETVVAFVVMRSQLEHGTLLAHCRSRLTAYKVPREIHQIPALPKNTSGKVDRIRLRQLGEGVSGPAQP